MAKRLIIWECDGYLVNEKQYAELDKRRNECRAAQYPLKTELEDKMCDYMEEQCEKWQYLGPVFLDWRR